MYSCDHCSPHLSSHLIISIIHRSRVDPKNTKPIEEDPGQLPGGTQVSDTWKFALQEVKSYLESEKKVVKSVETLQALANSETARKSPQPKSRSATPPLVSSRNSKEKQRVTVEAAFDKVTEQESTPSPADSAEGRPWPKALLGDEEGGQPVVVNYAKSVDGNLTPEPELKEEERVEEKEEEEEQNEEEEKEKEEQNEEEEKEKEEEEKTRETEWIAPKKRSHSESSDGTSAVDSDKEGSVPAKRPLKICVSGLTSQNVGTHAAQSPGTEQGESLGEPAEDENSRPPSTSSNRDEESMFGM